MWTAILTVQAGDFLQRMIEAIWPSFINFPNHLPANAGITSAEILCFMLYWVLQTSKCNFFNPTLYYRVHYKLGLFRSRTLTMKLTVSFEQSLPSCLSKS